MSTPLPIIQGSPLTASVATYYTVPSTDPRIKAVRLVNLRILNTDTVARTFDVYIVPRGASAVVGNARFFNYSVPAKASLLFDMDDVMLQGTTIQALSDAASVVAISATGETFP